MSCETKMGSANTGVHISYGEGIKQGQSVENRLAEIERTQYQNRYFRQRIKTLEDALANTMGRLQLLEKRMREFSIEKEQGKAPLPGL